MSLTYITAMIMALLNVSMMVLFRSMLKVQSMLASLSPGIAAITADTWVFSSLMVAALTFYTIIHFLPSATPVVSAIAIAIARLAAAVAANLHMRASRLEEQFCLREAEIYRLRMAHGDLLFQNSQLKAQQKLAYDIELQASKEVNAARQKYLDMNPITEEQLQALESLQYKYNGLESLHHNTLQRLERQSKKVVSLINSAAADATEREHMQNYAEELEEDKERLTQELRQALKTMATTSEGAAIKPKQIPRGRAYRMWNLNNEGQSTQSLKARCQAAEEKATVVEAKAARDLEELRKIVAAKEDEIAVLRNHAHEISNQSQEHHRRLQAVSGDQNKYAVEIRQRSEEAAAEVQRAFDEWRSLASTEYHNMVMQKDATMATISGESQRLAEKLEDACRKNIELAESNRSLADGKARLDQEAAGAMSDVPGIALFREQHARDIEGLNSEVRRLRQTVQDVTTAKEHLESQLVAANQAKEQKTVTESLKSELIAANQVKEEQAQQILQLQNERDQLYSEGRAVTSQRNSLVRELDGLRNGNDELIREVTVLHHNNTNLAREREAMTSAHNHLSIDRNTLYESNNNLANDNMYLCSEKESLQATITELQQRHVNLGDENHLLAQKLNQLKGAVEDADKESEAVITKHEVAVAELKRVMEENDGLKGIVDMRDQEIARFTNTNANAPDKRQHAVPDKSTASAGKVPVPADAKMQGMEVSRSEDEQQSSDEFEGLYTQEPAGMQDPEKRVQQFQRQLRGTLVQLQTEQYERKRAEDIVKTYQSELDAKSKELENERKCAARALLLAATNKENEEARIKELEECNQELENLQQRLQQQTLPLGSGIPRVGNLLTNTQLRNNAILYTDDLPERASTEQMKRRALKSLPKRRTHDTTTSDSLAPSLGTAYAADNTAYLTSPPASFTPVDQHPKMTPQIGAFSQTTVPSFAASHPAIDRPQNFTPTPFYTMTSTATTGDNKDSVNSPQLLALPRHVEGQLPGLSQSEQWQASSLRQAEQEAEPYYDMFSPKP